MKWSSLLIIGVALVVLIIGWRGTHNALWQSLGGTVNQQQKEPINIFPKLSTTFTPSTIPNIPSILTNPATLPNEPFNIISGAIGGSTPGSENLASLLSQVHGA
jgi:hypothetical protein